MGFTPKSLLSRPTLDTHQAYHYSIYQDISGSRAISPAGAMPIPVTEILAYCDLFKIDTLHERAQIFRYVTQMDSAYLAHVASKTSKPTKAVA